MTFPKSMAPKCNIVSPEEIEVNKLYAITMAPNDDLQYWTDEERVSKLEHYMINYILKDAPAVIDITMEVSRTGRLHYHGTIMFPIRRNIHNFYINTIHKWLNKFIIEIDTIKDLTVWLTYCGKCKDVMMEDVKIHSTKALMKRLKHEERIPMKPIQMEPKEW